MRTTFHLNEIDKVAEKILKTVSNKTLCFYGEMGAGKTTLIKAMVKQLGAVDLGNSPTFGLVNEYHDKKGDLLAYHFDFYRIVDETEALDMGLEDYLSSGVWIFMEWPEKISSLLPNEKVGIYLHFIDESSRSVEFSAD